MRMSRTVGRFAPSPSGRMHLGNLWSCLLAWLSARSAGGRIVLRLEDLDPDRCRQEYCDQVMRDLEWLGLNWDNEPVYQSRRTQAYAQAFYELERQGLIYPCFCTRAERLAASAPHRSDRSRNGILSSPTTSTCSPALIPVTSPVTRTYSPSL